jgi:hypothetical protein
MVNSSPRNAVSSLVQSANGGDRQKFREGGNLARPMQVDTDMRSNLITTLLFDLDLVFGSLIWPVRRWARRIASGG